MQQAFSLETSGGCLNFGREQNPLPAVTYGIGKTLVLQKSERGIKRSDLVKKRAANKKPLITMDTTTPVKTRLTFVKGISPKSPGF
jgi:hypothetical protein